MLNELGEKVKAIEIPLIEKKLPRLHNLLKLLFLTPLLFKILFSRKSIIPQSRSIGKDIIIQLISKYLLI
tara:strand:- start:971 stop:1180 length:210 start_codon:yes stop_codon:yes gene_type:complete